MLAKSTFGVYKLTNKNKILNKKALYNNSLIHF